MTIEGWVSAAYLPMNVPGAGISLASALSRRNMRPSCSAGLLSMAVGDAACGAGISCGAIATRPLQGTERIQVRAIELLIIDRELDLAVAEALHRLAQMAHAALALVAHLVEVDLDRDELLVGRGLMDDAAGRIEHRRLAVAAGAPGR